MVDVWVLADIGMCSGAEFVLSCLWMGRVFFVDSGAG